MPAARLILEDGTVYEGESFGSTENAIGEVVFNTSLALGGWRVGPPATRYSPPATSHFGRSFHRGWNHTHCSGTRRMCYSIAEVKRAVISTGSVSRVVEIGF